MHAVPEFPEERVAQDESAKNSSQTGVDPPRLMRVDMMYMVATLLNDGRAPQGMLPYPTDAAAATIATYLRVKEKHARKSVVDARVAGLFPGYPAGTFIYVMFHKPRGALCTRSENTRFAGNRDTIYDVLPKGDYLCTRCNCDGTQSCKTSSIASHKMGKARAESLQMGRRLTTPWAIFKSDTSPTPV
eukprot:1195865-Prorocentrum_minimum.AAC.8